MSPPLDSRAPARLFVIAGFFSLCAVIAGAVTCALLDVPTSVWMRNLAAWLTGGIAAWWMQRSGTSLLAALVPIAAVLLAATFLGPEQSGVYRWIGLGPLSINAAMLILPAAVVSLAGFQGKMQWPWPIAVLCMVILAAQPDRSQALAFGGALFSIATRQIQNRIMLGAIFALTALSIAIAFLRNDPLQPVPEVEGILRLAFGISPFLAGFALFSLFAFCLAPILTTRRSGQAGQIAGEALSVYFLICAIMPFFGAYPVPLAGVGISPVLGAWFAIGALAAVCSISRSTVVR